MLSHGNPLPAPIVDRHRRPGAAGQGDRGRRDGQRRDERRLRPGERRHRLLREPRGDARPDQRRGRASARRRLASARRRSSPTTAQRGVAHAARRRRHARERLQPRADHRSTTCSRRAAGGERRRPLPGPARSASLDYNFGNFFLEVTTTPTVVSRRPHAARSTPPRAPTSSSIATFNVENLDPSDAPAKFDRLARHRRRQPQRRRTSSRVEEVQDNNGATNDGDDRRERHAQHARRRDPGRRRADLPATARSTRSTTRTAASRAATSASVFLFRTDRGLAFVDAPGGDVDDRERRDAGAAHAAAYSPGRIDPTNTAWNSSRKPLAGEFTYNGQKLFVIANHFNSKGGDDPLFGRFQPPVRASRGAAAPAGDDRRATSSRQILAADPNAQGRRARRLQRLPVLRDA